MMQVKIVGHTEIIYEHHFNVVSWWKWMSFIIADVPIWEKHTNLVAHNQTLTFKQWSIIILGFSLILMTPLPTQLSNHIYNMWPSTQKSGFGDKI